MLVQTFCPHLLKLKLADSNNFQRWWFASLTKQTGPIELHFDDVKCNVKQFIVDTLKVGQTWDLRHGPTNFFYSNRQTKKTLLQNPPDRGIQ